MKWISINDLLPENGDWVLCSISMRDMSWVEILPFLNDRFITDGRRLNITHWMPKPIPAQVMKGSEV